MAGMEAGNAVVPAGVGVRIAVKGGDLPGERRVRLGIRDARRGEGVRGDEASAAGEKYRARQRIGGVLGGIGDVGRVGSRVEVGDRGSVLKETVPSTRAVEDERIGKLEAGFPEIPRLKKTPVSVDSSKEAMPRTA